MLPGAVCAVCAVTSLHALAPRLARHAVLRPAWSSSAGTQVGTVSATTSPARTGIEVVSANVAVPPK